nr:RelA/SpoT domain-containing protein [Bradyrhizobium sp. 150]
MQAIRRKLRRLPHQLCDLQDLGGCRVILPSIADVRTLVSMVRDRSRHIIRDENDYIKRPKKDGYRSHHLMLNFQGRDRTAVHDHRRIELQVRTRLQHSWATAVEAVGLFRGEDLKGNKGSENWLRLFKLMSAEFAMAESSKAPSNVPSHDDRVRELRELDAELDASAMLQNMSHAVRWTDIAVPSNTPARYYLIRFDNALKRVVVEPHFVPRWAMKSYDNAEELDNQSGRETSNVVLVEADKIENLKVAYPNYFGDVQLFKTQLNRLLKGKDVEEYTVAPQEQVNVSRPRENPDLVWFKRRIRWS